MLAEESHSLHSSPLPEPAASPTPTSIQPDQTALATENALRELLGLVPDDSFTHYKYAQFLISQERVPDAAAHYREALRLQPDYPDSLRGLAALLAAARKFVEAEELLRRCIAIRPDDVAALCDLGNVLVNARQPVRAIPFLRQALRLLPSDSRLYNNLGLAFLRSGLFQEAEQALFDALRIKPMDVGVHNNLGNLYVAMSRFEQAYSCFDLAESLAPNNPKTHANRAMALLSMGDFECGWQEYQWRWQRPESPLRPFPQPLWQGEDPAGQRILIHTEEGLGDRIQFIRYAKPLQTLGARVLVECPMPLLDVFRNVAGVDELVALGSPLPPFDAHVPLMNLPWLFKTTLATIPAQVPYLASEPERAASWRAWLANRTTPDEFLVGIAWQGNPHHEWDRFRSMPLMQFEPLTHITRVRLVSLQRGPGIEQIDAFQQFVHRKMLIPTEGTQNCPADLADTAAIMDNLDLIIAVDTATAHLAGALARPVWTALSTIAEWRWMTHRPDSPWYPTMRLFRQKRLGNWDELMIHMVSTIQSLLDT